MITLNEACGIYTEHAIFPIRYITESDTHWAFFPATDGGFYGAYIKVVNKETGEASNGWMLDYDDCPKVPIPTAYIKDPPPLRCQHPFEDVLSRADLIELGILEPED